MIARAPLIPIALIAFAALYVLEILIEAATR